MAAAWRTVWRDGAIEIQKLLGVFRPRPTQAQPMTPGGRSHHLENTTSPPLALLGGAVALYKPF